MFFIIIIYMIYLSLFKEFLILGAFTFGGAYSALPVIKDTMRITGWMNDEMLSNVIAITESTPGSFIVNLSSYIGSTNAGILGLIVATFAVILPAFLVIIIYSKFLAGKEKSRLNKNIFLALRPVICALISVSGFILFIENTELIDFPTNGHINIKKIIIFLVLLLIYNIYRKIKKKNLRSILFIIISAFLGIGIMYI